MADKEIENEETKPLHVPASMPLILSQQITELLKRSGATPHEQRTALDLARRLVMDEIFGY